MNPPSTPRPRWAAVFVWLLSVGLLLTLPGCGSSGGGSSSAAVGVPGPGDLDGDGARDDIEFLGWLIRVDRTGNGMDNAETIRVFSNPNVPDTDGDGLTDGEEYLLKTDPQNPDTDADGLTDREERKQWKTSAISVDTDGDARGPDFTRPPNPDLFDANEIKVLKTSPTLADTDGDARTDFEEYDNSFFSPRIAELPEAQVLVDPDGLIDVRLKVEYEETTGKESQYGLALTNSSTTTLSSSFETTMTAGVTNTIGVQAEASFPSGGSVGASAETSVSLETSIGISVSEESSRTAQTESSRYQTDSRTRTESFSSGTISVPIRIKNTGSSTFTLTDLSMTVSQYVPIPDLVSKPGDPFFRAGGRYKALATLQPKRESITLSPGATSPRLQIVETEIDASIIKEFLARPNSLVLEPSVFDLRDKEGINFQFLIEKTFQRTAVVEIQFDDHTERYRVATNVGRGADSSLSGIKMSEVMTDLIGLKLGDASENGYTVQEQEVFNTKTAKYEKSGIFVLSSIRGLKSAPYPGSSQGRRFPKSQWIVISSNEQHRKRAKSAADRRESSAVNFNDFVLRAGDVVRLVYYVDSDADILSDYEQAVLGTDAGKQDTDDDGLSDGAEHKFGWLVSVTNPLKRDHAYSNPRLKDSDGDGLDDGVEDNVRYKGSGANIAQVSPTDPLKPDTDGDGLLDPTDPWPLHRAAVWRVDLSSSYNQNAADAGTSWSKAFSQISKAVADANTRNADQIAGNDVAEIWVKQGVHASSQTITFKKGLSLYGGFVGNESTRSGRDPDPLTNNTTIKAATRGVHVLTAGTGVNPTDVVDGFTIGPSFSTGIYCSGGGNPTLRNLLFFKNRNNTSFPFGGGLYFAGISREDMNVIDCHFVANACGRSGTSGYGYGSAIYCVNGTLVLERCNFQGNVFEWNLNAPSPGFGTVYASTNTLRARGCVFQQNENRYGVGSGSALYLASVVWEARLEACDFFDNAIAGTGTSFSPATIFCSSSSDVALTNCRFWNNKASIAPVVYKSGLGDFTMTNCSVVGNSCSRSIGSALSVTGLECRIQNSILWNNKTTAAGSEKLFKHQIVFTDQTNINIQSIAYSCINEGAATYGSGNLGSGSTFSPKFVNQAVGNLRLDEESPCIDRGNNIVDIDPFRSGRQPLPKTDLDGKARIVDGDSQPGAVVDIGAYERQK